MSAATEAAWVAATRDLRAAEAVVATAKAALAVAYDAHLLALGEEWLERCRAAEPTPDGSVEELETAYVSQNRWRIAGRVVRRLLGRKGKGLIVAETTYRPPDTRPRSFGSGARNIIADYAAPVHRYHSESTIPGNSGEWKRMAGKLGVTS